MTKKIIKVQQHDNSLMHLTWLINNICPNKCSYCPSDLHAGKNHHYDWNNARKFFEILFQKYPKIHCSVSGGEASVSPFFREIVEIFDKAGHTIGATSNAAKPAQYWKDISNYMSYICFSYHPEFPDKNFVEKVTAASKNTYVTARVMMHPLHWDECVKVFNELVNLPNSFAEPVRIQDWGTPDKSALNYTEEQLQFFKDNVRVQKMLTFTREVPNAKINAGFYFDDNTFIEFANCTDYINAGMTNFNGYTCEVGLKSLFINFNGDVYIANCQIGGAIGNINDPNNIKWPTAPVVCNKNLCHCTSDVNINKHI